MSMTYNDLLNAVIDDGLAEVALAYPKPHQHLKLKGAQDGFNACRDLSVGEIAALLVEASAKSSEAMTGRWSDYWYYRFRALQIEFVANVISSAHFALGFKDIIIPPTVRGLTKAVDILGAS